MEIVAQNRGFVDKVDQELLEKHMMLFSDIKQIKASCTIVPAVVG